jgi:uncharacterized membrane protein
MDSFLILLAIAALLALLLGPLGFFLTLGARTRLKETEHKIFELQQALKDLRARAAPSTSASLIKEPAQVRERVTEEPAREAQQPTEATPVEEPVKPVPAQASPAAPQIQTPIPQIPLSQPEDRRDSPSLEERIGTRWAVWVGGIALALGALLLVRYSIEQGWFGPGARIVLGLAFSAAIIAGGEYLRRRDPLRHAPGDSPRTSQIPAVLTAAGTIGAFGSIYAAHAIYGFIGPAAVFLLLGAVGIAAMLAAALHGPWLAGLGLLGALTTPLLVQSNAPNPWPVVLYISVVVAFAYGLARLRSWLWLALGAAAGGFLWGFVLLAGNNANFNEAALVFVLIQTLMATALFAVIEGVAIADQDAQTDFFALFVPSAFAFLTLLILSQAPLLGLFGTGWIAGASASIAVLALGGLLAPSAAGLMLAAGIMPAMILLIWPPNGNLPLFPSQAWVSTWPHPKADSSFAAFAALASTGLALTSLRRLMSGLTLRGPVATIYAGAATLIPLGVLIIAYLRLSHSEINFPFAAIAGALALVFLIAANVFFARDRNNPHPTQRLGLGAMASAALAALALGLVFTLDRGMLTVALALAALGAAFVDRRLNIDALRWCAAGLGLIIAARLFYEPRIVGGDLGATPIFNWLLWGYGVPAACFGIASQLLHRRGQDTPVLVAQGLSILFSALLFFFEIRHAINEGHPFTETSNLIEQGLFATTAFGFSIVLTKLDVMRTSPVLRIASLGFGIVSFAVSLIGLLIVENPLWSGEPVEGGLIVNALLLTYGLPALLAFFLSRTAKLVRPIWYWQGARIAGLLLLFAFTNLQLRRFFHDADLSWIDGITPDAEIYAYSALWLALSILCLAYGLWRGSVTARLASASLMLMTILKVFLYDLAGLTGVLRALSFIGLGLVLIGIGLVYQRLVFGRPLSKA